MAAVQIVPVAERAGIAAGTVYRYFPSKTELVGELARVVSTRELDAVRRAAAAAPGPLSALAAALATFAARALRAPRLAYAVMAEPADPAIDSVRLAYRRALAAEIEARIRAAIAAGHLPDQDAALAAASIGGALIEALLSPLAPQVLNDAAAARAAVQALTLFALRGLGVVDARARGIVVGTALPSSEQADVER